MEPAPTVITFGRRKKSDQSAPVKKDVPAALSAPSPAAVLTPLPGQSTKPAAQASPEEDEIKETIPARWRRKGAKAPDQAFVAEMKAHFKEVDAFELAVETPTPPRRPSHARVWRHAGPLPADGKPRPMSLGLSRRSSALAYARLSNRSIAAVTPSPLRISMGPRMSLQTLHEHPDEDQNAPALHTEASSPAAAAVTGTERAATSGRPSQPWSRRRTGSLAPLAPGTGRRSSAAHVLNRVSMGIGEALQWLTKRGSLPGTAELEGRVVSRISEASGSAVLAGGEDAEPREAGIFTITEEKEGEGSPSGSESGSPSGGEPEAAAEVAGPVGETAPTPSVAKCAEKAEPRELAEDFATKLALSDDASTATTGPGEGAAPEEADPSTPAAASPPFVELEPLDQLLKLCGQQGDIAGLPSMEELLGRHVDLTRVKKIGEGTFGEAFKAGNVVLKIVPMEGTVLVNGEPQKRAEEILAEVAITLTLSGLREDTASGPSEAAAENSDPNAPGAVSQAAMRRSNVTAGFVETFGVGICRGRYAEALRKEWHAWDLANGSENDPVDIFEGDQLFVVFVVADGGVDLEHFEPRSFEEIRSILMQLTMTLAVAEEACQFEHRDLHWGNLLIVRDGTEAVQYRLRDVDITVQAAGVRVTLIDFTLSRLVTSEGEVAFCDLSLDPEIFNGPKGDIQAETYRRMRKATGGDWQRHVPGTNTLWLHYLADVVLAHKLPAACGRDAKSALRGFRKDAMASQAAAELVWHELFSGQWTGDAA